MEKRREKPETMKKAPETGALDRTLFCPPLSGHAHLLLFLGGGFLLRGGFLGCALHRLILPKHQNFAIRKSQCDSYIRLFGRKVKKKMHSTSGFGTFRAHRRDEFTEDNQRLPPSRNP